MKKIFLLTLFLFICETPFAQQHSGQGSVLSFESVGDGYRDALIRKVSANTRYSRDEKVNRNLSVSFLIHQSPRGEVTSVEKLKDSGVPDFDNALWDGILRASPMPRRTDGSVDAELRLDFREK